ncbi:mannose-6-phosphate isomerase 1-like [Hibiscus syriacus]|uniref:mannose-6-phosphate isomerase 1-like n=1 Tax=Hibiscus syriacus TaxID=106335 RepID=UPI001924ACA0|nr:mannose-6-phosphate isomerase 1-like [Hibiscus syriacus]
MAKANVEKIEPDRPYAKFWMGTRDSEPIFMADDNGECGNLGLRDWILKNPNVLGHKVLKKWGHDLHFLFKILSLAKPLSRQAHPDKELAKELHKLKRNLYKDANHKPEMALSITKFRTLCGFITFEGSGTVGASDVPTSSVEANAHSHLVSRVLDSEEATSKMQKKLEKLHLRSYNLLVSSCDNLRTFLVFCF